MSLTSAVKRACNPSLNEKLLDHTHYVSPRSCEATGPSGGIRKQRQKNLQVTFRRPHMVVRRNYQPALALPYHLHPGIPAQTLQPPAMVLGMELVAGEHLLALTGATAEPRQSPSPLTPCFRSSRS